MLPRNGESAEDRERRIKTHTRLRLEVPEPPLRNVRAAALEAVRECRISIKTDHYQAGRLFQDFAYRVIFPDGDTPARLARKKSVSDLAGDTAEQTRKNINDIVSSSVRKIILEEFDKRKDTGKSIKEIFAAPFLIANTEPKSKKFSAFKKSDGAI